MLLLSGKISWVGFAVVVAGLKTQAQSAGLQIRTTEAA